MLNYQFNDGGRSQSKRPKQKNDCVIRAIVLVMPEYSYDYMYDFVAEKGRKCSRGTAKEVWQYILSTCPSLKKISFPAQKGIKRMDLATFHKQYNTGTFIVQCAGHLTVVKDGIVLDSFEPRESACVYAVWQKI